MGIKLLPLMRLRLHLLRRASRSAGKILCHRRARSPRARDARRRWKAESTAWIRSQAVPKPRATRAAALVRCFGRMGIAAMARLRPRRSAANGCSSCGPPCRRCLPQVPFPGALARPARLLLQAFPQVRWKPYTGLIALLACGATLAAATPVRYGGHELAALSCGVRQTLWIRHYAAELFVRAAGARRCSQCSMRRRWRACGRAIARSKAETWSSSATAREAA